MYQKQEQNSYKTILSCVYTLFFVQINQTSYNMLISYLIRGGIRWYLLPFYKCRLAIYPCVQSLCKASQLLAVASHLQYKHEHITDQNKTSKSDASLYF